MNRISGLTTFLKIIILGVLFTIVFVVDDITHIITLGLIGIFLSSVVATFANVLETLLREAVRIKTENDLPVFRIGRYKL